MATIPLDFFNRYVAGGVIGTGEGQNRLMANQFGGGFTPPVSNTNKHTGDTLAISLYFLDQGSLGVPYRGHRYAGATVEVNLFALGNSHIYAQGISTTEIAPSSSAPSIVQTQAGVAHDTGERQRVIFASAPFTGVFTLTFPGPTLVGAPSGVAGPKGTTAPIDPRNGIAGIQAAIRALPFYMVYNGVASELPHDTWSARLTVTGTVTDFIVNYMPVPPNSSQGAGPLPLLTINATDIQYAFGYSVSVPLTAGDYNNLFLGVNGPAYLDVILNGVLTAQYQLVSAGDSGLPPVTEFSADTTTIAPGASVQFTDLTTNNPTSWAWNFGDGSTSTSQNPSHTYAAAGSYTVTLVATNATSSDTKTKPGYITVGSVAPPNPGGYPTGIIFDDGGRLQYASPMGDVRYISNPLPFQANAIVIRQRFKQLHSFFVKQALNSEGPNIGAATYLVGETELEDLGAGICAWDREWATLPSSYSIPTHANKNYIFAQYAWSGTTITEEGIVSWTQLIKATATFTYYLDPSSVPNLPGLPILLMVKYFNSQVLTDVGSGFPTRTYPFGVGFDNNSAPCYINATIEPYMGKMICVQTVTG